MKIFFEQETRVYSQEEIETILTVIHGSIMNRIRHIIKQIIIAYKNLFFYKLIIITNKFVYIFGLCNFKKELCDDSVYLYLMTEN